MGHTIPPFTWQYKIEKDYFGKFRRALLLAGDKRLFDDIWNQAEFHIPAAEKASHPLPIATILMMMILEQHKTIDLLQNKTNTLIEKVDKLEIRLKNSETQNIYLTTEIENIKESLQDFQELHLTQEQLTHEFTA